MLKRRKMVKKFTKEEMAQRVRERLGHGVNLVKPAKKKEKNEK